MRIQWRSKTQQPMRALIGVFLVLMAEMAIAGATLEQRVREYWEARQINDIPTYYRLEAAALPGGGLTPDQYRAIAGLPVREVKILDIKVENDRAEVKIEGKIEVGALGWTPQTVTDTWVLINGEWYRRTPGFDAKPAPSKQP